MEGIGDSWENCKADLAIEEMTPEDIPEDFAGPGDRVAVTAGASTPQWLLEDVCRRLRALSVPP